MYFDVEDYFVRDYHFLMVILTFYQFLKIIITKSYSLICDLSTFYHLQFLITYFLMVTILSSLIPVLAFGPVFPFSL